MRVALIGCGGIAQVHAAALRNMPEIDLCAFADIRLERAEALAKGAATYSDYRQMLAQIKPQVVHVCTPHYLHAPMAIDCLLAGVDVFMEKPAVINQAQLDELLRAQQASGKRLGLCLQNRYNPNILYIKQQIEAGALGKLLGGMGIVAWDRDEAYYANTDWRGRLDREGGGVLINQAVHTLDLLHFVMGSVAQVEASMANHHLQGKIEVEDTMEAYLRFEGGHRASFYCTNAYVRNAPVMVEFVCERGSYRAEGSSVWTSDLEGRTTCQDFPPPDLGLGKDYWGHGHAACIRDYYAAIAENRPFALSIANAKASIELMLACYRSAREHRPVRLS